MSEIDPRAKKAFDSLEQLKQKITLPKGTVLFLHHQPIELISDTVILTDPSGLTFVFTLR